MEYYLAIKGNELLIHALPQLKTSCQGKETSHKRTHMITKDRVVWLHLYEME